VGTKAREINVLFENGQEMAAVVLWQDPALDLAIIKVDAAGLPQAELGDSTRVAVGDIAIAIGSPLGLRFPEDSNLRCGKRPKQVADGWRPVRRGHYGGPDSDPMLPLTPGNSGLDRC
jgi:hypothetical protein